MYVRYNGETMSYQGCSSASKLQEGRIYKVEGKDIYPYQTDYYLAGVEGHFNSVWFESVPSFFAFGKDIPRVGRTMDVWRQEVREGKFFLEHFYTTPVHSVEQISANVYLAVTANTVYIVQVLS